MVLGVVHVAINGNDREKCRTRPVHFSCLGIVSGCHVTFRALCLPTERRFNALEGWVARDGVCVVVGLESAPRFHDVVRVRSCQKDGMNARRFI